MTQLQSSQIAGVQQRLHMYKIASALTVPNLKRSEGHGGLAVRESEIDPSSAPLTPTARR